MALRRRKTILLVNLTSQKASRRDSAIIGALTCKFLFWCILPTMGYIINALFFFQEQYISYFHFFFLLLKQRSVPVQIEQPKFSFTFDLDMEIEIDIEACEVHNWLDMFKDFLLALLIHSTFFFFFLLHQYPCSRIKASELGVHNS